VRQAVGRYPGTIILKNQPHGIGLASNPDAYRETATKLAALFRQNFEKFGQQAGPEVIAAGPIG